MAEEIFKPMETRGYCGGWGARYGNATETHLSQHTQGTVIIDLIAHARKQLVWETVGIGRVSEEILEKPE
jgi:hypothetical protein